MFRWLTDRWRKPPVDTYVFVEGFTENQDTAWWQAFKEHCKKVNFHYDSEMWTSKYCPCTDCTDKLEAEKLRLAKLAEERERERYTSSSSCGSYSYGSSSSYSTYDY